MKTLILDFDKNIFFFFQGLQNPVMDYFLGWPTYLGGTVVLLTVLISAILIFDRRGLRKIPAAALGVLSANWLAEILKIAFARVRPHLLWENIHVIFVKPENNAFPSGHTAVIFAGAFTLNFFYGEKMRWTYAVAVWVALTRIYVGAHYPTDLAGGAVTGIFCAFLACRYIPGARPSEEKLL